jgi:hypothetical protein
MASSARATTKDVARSRGRRACTQPRFVSTLPVTWTEMESLLRLYVDALSQTLSPGRETATS